MHVHMSDDAPEEPVATVSMTRVPMAATGFEAMVGAIGTLIIDTFATSSFSSRVTGAEASADEEQQRGGGAAQPHACSCLLSDRRRLWQRGRQGAGDAPLSRRAGNNKNAIPANLKGQLGSPLLFFFHFHI